MKIFCPKCGKEGQSPNSYCRNCGNWLNHPDQPLSFLKETGELKILLVIGLNLLCFTAAVYIAITLIGNFGSERAKFTAGLLALSIALWQISIVLYVSSIRRHLHKNRRIKNQSKKQRKEVGSAVRSAELPVANTGELSVPASATENQTELFEPVLKIPKLQFKDQGLKF